MSIDYKIGQRFNSWTVIRENGKSNRGRKAFEFQCDCGYLTTKEMNKVTSGATKECRNCSKVKFSKLREIQDLTGKRFGERVAVERFNKIKSSGNEWWYRCVCDFGHCKDVSGQNLNAGNRHNCLECNNHSWSATHRASKTREYNSWKSMIRRCTSPKSISWKDYGGRGISVEDKNWFIFDNFLLDMGIRPEGRTLDRIDNSKGYSKSNCRWATLKEQEANKRSKRIE